MIATLIAQDFRAIRKSLFAVVGITLLVTVVSLTLTVLRIPVIGGIGLVVGIAAAIALTVIVLGLLVANYWRTMYGREGYFTMTLPVHGRTLFIAKVLHGLVIAIAAAALSAIALVGAAVAFALSEGLEPFEFLRTGLGMVEPWMVWFAASSLLLQIVYLVVAGAGLMSIGAQERYNHLGFGAPLIGAVVVYLVMQVVTFAAIMFVPLGLVMVGPDAGTLVPRGMLDAFIAALHEGDPAAASGQPPQVLGLGFVFTSAALIVVMAWWGARSVEHRTSLR
ncbi:hypothetical protein [Microbacterium sp.]|uniref:hypothetical protein n=1 Tax=Microbacterium sp. TaxID=51671 RepID=UPI0039E22B99